MLTFPESIKEFITHCKVEKNLSVKTIKAYEIDLRQVTEFLIKRQFKLPVSQLSKLEIRDYLESISALKPKSIKRKVATLKVLFNYLEFEDRIPTNPMRKMRIKIKEDKRLPKVLNITEMGSLFRSAYTEKGLNLKVGSYSYFESLRNIAVIELLFATGARVSEIANLKEQQIDLNSGEVRIKGKGNKERVVQICNKETLLTLRNYRKLYLGKMNSAEGYFLINRFNAKISDQSIRQIVKNLSRKASIQSHVTPHVFRHSFATLLLEKDVDIKYIQSFLGHSSIMTTQLYTHVNREKQKQILQAKHPRKDFSSKSFVLPEAVKL